jgi:hypothetical protein
LQNLQVIVGDIICTYLHPIRYKKNNSYPLWVILLLTCFIARTQAQQLNYEKLSIEGGYRFEYQWLNHNKMKQDIAFTLTQAGLFDRFRHLKSYHIDYAQKNNNQAYQKTNATKPY